MPEDTKSRREIVVINRSEGKEPDAWGKLERVSRVLSVAAVPVVLALGGWFVQSRIQQQTAAVQQQLQTQNVSKDYVQLAVSILREPDQSKVRPEMRDWAVDLLNAYSAVKLKEEVARQLKNGQTLLPPLETFAADPSSAMTPELDGKLRPALEEFQRYLGKAGFRIAGGDRQVRYRVVEGRGKDGLFEGYASFYEGGTLTVARQHLGDFDLIRHEYMRHVLEPGFPDSRDYGDARWWAYFSVNSGLAVYFPCSFKNAPVFAEKDQIFRIELNDAGKLTPRPRDMDAADALGNRAWASAFWELRERVGDAAVADNLLALAWVSWQPADPGADLPAEFVGKVIEADRARFGGRHVGVIQEVFQRRGLQV